MHHVAIRSGVGSHGGLIIQCGILPIILNRGTVQVNIPFYHVWEFSWWNCIRKLHIVPNIAFMFSSMVLRHHFDALMVSSWNIKNLWRMLASLNHLLVGILSLRFYECLIHKVVLVLEVLRLGSEEYWRILVNCHWVLSLVGWLVIKDLLRLQLHGLLILTEIKLTW